MFAWIWILEVVFLVAEVLGDVHKLTDLTCEQFEIGARFDPYETIDSMWKIFYFWGNTTEAYPIMFNLPQKQQVERFRAAMQANHPDVMESVPWRHAALLMEPRPGIEVLLLYQGIVGSFRALIKLERYDQARPHPAPWIKISDIRMKIVGRFMGMMACEEQTGYALSRVYELPETEEECEKTAAKLGFPLGGGRSHLYIQNLLNKDEL